MQLLDSGAVRLGSDDTTALSLHSAVDWGSSSGSLEVVGRMVVQLAGCCFSWAPAET